MSMISSQVGELRFMAHMLDTDGHPSFALEVRRAADTIWELRNKLAGTVDQSERIIELEDENAKLRKLARGLNWCTENAKVPSAECEHCPLGDTEDGELSCEKLMRELGIEED